MRHSDLVTRRNITVYADMLPIFMLRLDIVLYAMRQSVVMQRLRRVQFVWVAFVIRTYASGRLSSSRGASMLQCCMLSTIQESV